MKAITTPQFDEAYKKLNPAQKKAVDAIDGPVMVIAGPGTGKTQMLTLRIANILRETDTAPSSILALTFTESAVGAMRKRLVEIIGAAGHAVYISTFHGFCNDIIANNPDAFPHIVGSTNATEINQIQIMEAVISRLKLALLKPYGDPFYYLRPAMSALRELKREKISPKEFEALIAGQEKEFSKIPDLYHEKGAHKGKMKGVYSDLQKKIAKNRELAAIYQGYADELRTQRLYDFEDMILETIAAFESNEDLLLQTQERFQYILADEHQDANKAQNRLLELLASFHDNPNIFVVGDEKQAIFRFQGASLENFLHFKTLYPKALIVSLENNYRSTQGILDASHSLIEKNKAGPIERVRLMSAGEKVGKKEDLIAISLGEFSTPEFELRFLLKDIEERIATGADPSRIAVIYRDNRDADPIIRAFERTTIPFVVQSDQHILADRRIQAFLILLRAISDFGHDECLAEALYIDFLGIPTLDAYKLLAYAAKERKALHDVIGNAEDIEKAGIGKKDAVLGLSVKLSEWKSKAKNSLLADAFEVIVRESGFMEQLLNLPNSADICAKLDLLFSEAKKVSEENKEARLEDFLRYLQILEEYRIIIKSTGNFDRPGVRLMTAHKSKGLEFETVYIVGAYDTHWGNKRDIRHFHMPDRGLSSYEGGTIEDERRLFYVALTRAKKHIVITYAAQNIDGKTQLPAQFIDEIDSEFLTRLSTGELEKEFGAKPLWEYEERKEHGIPLSDKRFLQELFLRQGLSVTALNNYLKCPWEYFFNNLLRIPTAPTKHQAYGTAIHAALKFFFDGYAKGGGPSSEEVVGRFETCLHAMPLSKEDFAASLEKGKRALAGYLTTYAGSWPKEALTEVRISGSTIDIVYEKQTVHIPLRGTLDRLEPHQDGTATVVDYKTAEPKSRNEIMGATKNASGDYHRQLVFYKLLLGAYEGGRYEMTEGVIDFIEPDKSGKYKRELFSISDADVAALKETIARVANEILTIGFWNSVCDDKDCRFCHLRKMIQDRNK